MEKYDIFTLPNCNGRRYKVDMLNNTIREWAKNNGVFIEGEKDVNYFCQREKNARKYDTRMEYVESMHHAIDHKNMFIDYINLLVNKSKRCDRKEQ